MKRTLLALVAILAWAPSARAIDIDGRWGLGVGAGGVIGTRPEFSIFHGHSKKTGWLLDFSVSGSDGAQSSRDTFVDTSGTSVQNSSANANSVSSFMGPRVRRFTRPDADFSPYIDLYLHGLYSRVHGWDSSNDYHFDSSSYGFATGVALGAEYFTPWHFSVAAHSDLASLDWSHFRDERRFRASGNEMSGHTTRGNFLLSPVLFLRVYF